MKKVLATMLGVILATGAVSALAGKQDREGLTQCKAAVEAYYGDHARTRLRSIRRGGDATQFRLMVTTRAAGNQVVVCSVDSGGSSRLADRDGVALVPVADAPTVSLAR